MTESSHDTPTQETDYQRAAFSPRILLLQINAALGYLLRQWKIILAAGLLFGLTGYILSTLQKPSFAAEITFALDEGAAQSAKTEYSQLSEQLGLGSIMDAGGMFSSVTNIVELMQSRLMIEKTLRSTVQLNSHHLVFADFFLDSLGYREKWLQGSTDSLHFEKGKKSLHDSLAENNVIRNIYETLLAKYIKIDKKGKGTSIISVTSTTEHELFSKYFLEALIAEVTSYYIATKTQRAKANVDFLSHRTDSMRNAFSASLYGRASFADAHLNPALQVGTVTADKQQTDIQVNRSAYMDLVRSLETAKTTLMRETPLIQYIDTPILPLKMNSPSAAKKSFLFFIAGIFITSLFLLSLKLYRYILNE